MKTKQLFLTTILLCSLLMYVQLASAQNVNCCNGNTASIQIPNDSYDERVSEFKKSSTYKTLRDNCGGNHPLTADTIALTTFFNFIKNAPVNTKGVKIYFGAFNQGSKPKYNQLVPIYAFTSNNTGNDQTDISNAYYIYNAEQKRFESITFAYAKELHLHYTKKLKLDSNEVFALWFPMPKLTEWMDDICCQQNGTNGMNIKEVMLDWAVYEKDINDPVTKFPLKTKGRITLLFKIPNARSMQKKEDGMYDTAVPCPPGQNCDNGLGGK